MRKRIVTMMLLKEFPGVSITRAWMDDGILHNEVNHYKLSLNNRMLIFNAKLRIRNTYKLQELDTNQGVLVTIRHDELVK